LNYLKTHISLGTEHTLFITLKKIPNYSLIMKITVLFLSAKRTALQLTSSL
jgi:hypothetical protein